MVLRARQDATRYQHDVLSPQRQKTLLREAHVSPAWARLWHVAVPLQILVHLGKIRSPDGVKNIFVCERENFALTLCLLKSHHPKKSWVLPPSCQVPQKKELVFQITISIHFFSGIKVQMMKWGHAHSLGGGHQLLFWGRVGLPSHKTWDGGWATLICKWDQQQNGMSFLFHVPWWPMDSYKTIPSSQFNHAWSLGSLQGLRSHDHQRIQSLGDDHVGSCLVAY